MNIPRYHYGKKFARIRDLFYYLKCKFFHPYNRVTAKDIPPTWIDRDQLMLHVNFQILVDYVEKEEALKVIDWDWCEDKKLIKNEIESLYKWWKVDRQAKIDDIRKRYDVEYIKSGFSDKSYNILKEEDEIYYVDDTEHLIRLMKIRNQLWT